MIKGPIFRSIFYSQYIVFQGRNYNISLIRSVTHGIGYQVTDQDFKQTFICLDRYICLGWILYNNIFLLGEVSKLLNKPIYGIIYRDFLFFNELVVFDFCKSVSYT